jgi:Flp pilus assembly pilin Flp
MSQMTLSTPSAPSALSTTTVRSRTAAALPGPAPVCRLGGGGPCGPSRRSLGAALRDDSGASTAEYAITVLAACGFAAVLVVLLKSGEVRDLLMNIITSALSLGQ